MTATMIQPYLSVVVPTYNRIAMLEMVLQSLGAQHDPPDFEVIVVNDGSNDDTVARVEALRRSGSISYPFTFVSQTNGGPGRARNRGVGLAAGKYILFIGDDTVPERSFLAEHARVHLDSDDDRMVACLGYTGWPASQRATSFMHYINDYGLQFGYKLIEHGAVVPFNFFYTSNISLSRELMLEFPFDTSFPAAAWEDIEVAYRLDHLGLKIHYNSYAVTRHHHDMTVDSFARRQYTVGKSGAIFYEKHPELGHFLGVHELPTRPLADEKKLRRMRRVARVGERISLFARPKVYEELMREHYLRGLKDGLAERASRATE